jgi:hypothetical protein
VTVSSPVNQLLSWNQKWLCKLPQTLLKQFVFWVVLTGTSPAWSSSLPLSQSSSDFKQPSLRPQEPLKEVQLKKVLMDRASASLSPQIASGLSGAETYGQRQPRIVFSRNSVEADLSPPQTVIAACWKSPSTQFACSFSPSQSTLIPDKQALSQVPLNPLRDAPNRAQSTTPLEPTAKLEDSELGVIITKPVEELDPELGLPRLQERLLEPRPLPSAARQPSVYLVGRVDYFRTTNVFSGVDPVNDGLIRSGLTLFYAPAIGRNTYLVTSIDGSLIRYGNLGYLNYNELRLRAGVLQRLSPRTFGEIGWSNQQLFATKEGLRDALHGDRFLNDHAIRFELSRQDTLSTKLALNTFYQLRMSFADPNDRSRLINSFITSLSYSWSPNFQTALDYQVAWSHFTQQPRDDVYHQLVARLTYTITPQSQFNVFSGFSFGDSSDSRIDFNSFILGVGIVLNLPLF